MPGDRNIPPDPYFQHYDRNDSVKTTGYFREALSSCTPHLSEPLKSNRQLTILAFGSATERNISEIQDFLHDTRPNSAGQDKILILDIAEHPLRRHAEFVQTKKLRNVTIINGDMNTAPIPSNSTDMVISDFSINFNLHHSGYDETLASAGRVLSEQGFLILGVCIDPRPENEATDLYQRHTSVDTTAITRSRLNELLAKNGLQTIYEEEIPNNPWKPAIRLLIKKSER